MQFFIQKWGQVGILQPQMVVVQSVLLITLCQELQLGLEQTLMEFHLR